MDTWLRSITSAILLQAGRGGPPAPPFAFVAAQGKPEEVLRPEILARAFGMAADVIEGPDGRPVVVARVEPPEPLDPGPGEQDSPVRDC